MSASASNKFVDVKTVLIVLSSKSMEYDPESLRHHIRMTYPEGAVFFTTVSGKALGVEAPNDVDLVIDFTPPAARQSFWFPRKMRARARYVVGRNAGWLYRKKRYDRVFDEKTATLPTGFHERERFVQRQVLEYAGVKILKQGEVAPDRGRSIALELNNL